MRVYTKLIVDMNTPLPGGQFAIVDEASYDYAGPIALAKKGRGEAEAAAKGGVKLGDQASSIATTNQGIQSGYRTAGDTAAKTYFAQPTDPSGLNQYNRSQFELDKSNIAKSMSDTLGVGQKLLAQRGFQSSPGALSSMVNTASRNAADQDRQAYTDALGRQQQLGLQGIGYNQQQQQLYNPLSAIGTASGAYGQGGSSAAQRAGMGSGVGDVIGGIGTLAGAAGSVMSGIGRMRG